MGAGQAVLSAFIFKRRAYIMLPSISRERPKSMDEETLLEGSVSLPLS